MPVVKDGQDPHPTALGAALHPQEPALGGKGGKGAMGAQALAPDAPAVDPVPEPAVNDQGAPMAVDQAGPGPSSSSSQVKLPLEVNSRVDCRWRDGQYHNVKIIERRPPPSGGDNTKWEYYVHYIGFNRRMDEWVSLEQMDLNTVELEVAAEGEGPGRKGQKRKMDMDALKAPPSRKDTAHPPHAQSQLEDDESDHGHYDQNALREHEEFTKVKNIDWIELGRHELETWYFSPLPPEYSNCKKLFFCEYCLRFFKRRPQLLRHLGKCHLHHPPGDEIYRNGSVAMFEVDGRKERTYCQNLCFLAKLFLDHKTLYYDVDLFLFYIMCELDERGAHITGYFSKEKSSEDGYNLACILSLPPYQRKGYGKFLISMSYELSKIEGKVGSPEKPLSDLGKVSYRGYWTRVLLGVLKEREGSISVKELADITAITTDDILSTLQYLNLVQYQKGQHVICAAPRLVDRLLVQAGSPGLQVDPSKIIWTPYNAEHEYQNYRK